MTREEIRLQVAISVIQGVLEWFRETKVEKAWQKPAEWSEEDTEMYINVASSLRGYACGLENEEHKRHIQKGLDWLENRFKSLRPQPKQENWTDKDQTLLSDALGCVTMVEELKKRGELKNFHLSCPGVELRSWIRSLKSRPRKQSYEWSKEDKRMCDTLIRYLSGLSREICPEWIDWIHDLPKRFAIQPKQEK